MTTRARFFDFRQFLPEARRRRVGLLAADLAFGLARVAATPGLAQPTDLPPSDLPGFRQSLPRQNRLENGCQLGGLKLTLSLCLGPRRLRPMTFIPMQLKTETVRKSIGLSADIAKPWFESRTEPKKKIQFDGKGQLNDAGTGSVYVYYAQDDSNLYVGQTGRRIKARLHDQTSPHKRKVWWPNWSYIRFVQLPDEMDRLVLEFPLILAYSPRYNEKPGAKDLSALFPN